MSQICITRLLLRVVESTPNMTGRRFHRTMEMIPALPSQSKSPSVSTPIKQSTKEGAARGGSEVRRRISPIHFHCPAPRSSSHIGHGLKSGLLDVILLESCTGSRVRILGSVFPFSPTLASNVLLARILNKSHVCGLQKKCPVQIEASGFGGMLC